MMNVWISVRLAVLLALSGGAIALEATSANADEDTAAQGAALTPQTEQAATISDSSSNGETAQSASTTMPDTASADELPPAEVAPTETAATTNESATAAVVNVADLTSETPAAPAATTVDEWLAQIEASLTQITGVQIEETEAGLQIVLETAEGELAMPATQTVGNALIADIPNAVLALPEGDSFEQFSPAEGIALVQVTNEPGDQVRVAITGTDAPPVAEVTATGLAVTLGEAVAGAEDDAIQVVVTGEEDEGYNPSSATTATRTDTPLRDIPQSIQVVPRQVIEDRNTRTVIESVETVSGVVYNGGFADAPTGGLIIRGFSQPQQFRNGFRDTDRGGLTGIGTVESIEVLKGPASVLFGTVEPGGIVNVITRQPLSDPQYQLSFELGNRSYYQPGIDFTGPLTSNDSVLYRLIANYESTDGFQEFTSREVTTLAPTLAFNIGENTDLSFYYEYINYLADTPEDYSFLLSDGSRPSRDFYAGYPDLSFRDFTTQKFGYSFNHSFNENWQIRSNLSAALSATEEGVLFGDSITDDRFLEFFVSDREFTRDNYYANVEVLSEFETGNVSHQLLFGVDGNWYNDTFEFSTGNVPALDIQNPNYDVTTPVYTPAFRDANYIDRYGLYLQDQIRFSDSIQMLIGGRFDLISQRTEVEGEATQEQDDSSFSPRVGLVYQPSDTVSLYTSYSQSFAPTFDSNPGEDAFEPTEGTQYEIGAKADFLDGRLSATLAGYQITRSNITTTDPNNPNFSIQVGEQRSRGVELDVTGEVLPGWNIVASYAYTDAIVTEDNDTPEGNRLTNVPEHQVSLWTTYEIQEGDLKGLGFGLGLFYVGERQGDLANSFVLDDYFRTDAALYYRRNQFNAAINFRNLFNTDYFRASDGGNLFLFRGEPFTVTASVSWEF